MSLRWGIRAAAGQDELDQEVGAMERPPTATPAWIRALQHPGKPMPSPTSLPQQELCHHPAAAAGSPWKGRAARIHRPPAKPLRDLESIIVQARELAHCKGTVTSGSWNGISFCSNCHLLPLPVAWVWGGPGHGSLGGQEPSLLQSIPSQGEVSGLTPHVPGNFLIPG